MRSRLESSGVSDANRPAVLVSTSNTATTGRRDGGLDEQDAIFSYLFAKRTPLVKMAVSQDVAKSKQMPLEAGPTT